MAYQKNYSAQANSDKAIDAFTEMIISRLSEIKASKWKKGWIGGSGFQGLPQNLNGRNYSGTNSLFLFMDTAMNGYAAPVYMTFLQKEKEGLRLKKGAQAMPVVYWDMSIKGAEGKKVSLSDYKTMSKEEKEKCDIRPFLRSFRVYNIDQTNMQEVNQEKYNNIIARFKSNIVSDVQGMYKNNALDRMFEQQEWLCRIIHDQPSSRAYYSPSKDMIVIPQKEQFKTGKKEEDIFKDGMEYYSTALHEMAHSTGAAKRLNRNLEGRFGDPKYAKEELVAELSAAMVGNTMGFDRRIEDNNIAYIDSWLRTLREEPRFIVSVMADVNKASTLILEKVDEQKLALGEKTFLNDSKDTDMDLKKSAEIIIPKWNALDNDKPYTKQDISDYTTLLEVTASKVKDRVSDARILETENGFKFLDFKIDGKNIEYPERELPKELRVWISNVSTETESLRKNGNINVLHKGDNINLVAALVYADVISKQNVQNAVETPKITAGIYKQNTGSFVVRASVDGKELEQKIIDNKTAASYFKAKDITTKNQILSNIVRENYGDIKLLPHITQQVSKGLKRL